MPGRLDPVLFPTLEARNLNGRTLVLPSELDGERNILLIAFQRWHQSEINSWSPALNALLAADPELRAYEVPMIAGFYTMARPVIDAGMALAITGSAARERTLTVYTDVRQTMAALEITHPWSITLMLVDRQGQIGWRDQGSCTPRKASRLEHALAARLHPPQEAS